MTGYPTYGAIGPDKLATTPAHFVMVRGVKVSSRYQKQDEIVLMSQVVSKLPDWAPGMMEEIWYDSKATSVFTIKLRSAHSVEAVAIAIAHLAENLLIELGRGHNGLYVEGDDLRPLYSLDPDWDIDD